MSDQEIMQLLRSQKHEKAFHALYSYFPNVKKLIISNGGKKEDAEDLYQEALIVLCKKVAQPGFKLTSGLGTYLYSICRYMWKDELKKRNKTIALRPDAVSELLENDFDETVEEEMKLKLSEVILRDLGDRCLELLKLFYFEMNSMKMISEKLGFSSEQIAKNQKYKCMERAKMKLKEMKLNKKIIS